MKFLFAVCTANVSATYLDAEDETHNVNISPQPGSVLELRAQLEAAVSGPIIGFQIFAETEGGERVEALTAEGVPRMLGDLSPEMTAQVKAVRADIIGAI